MKIKFVPKYCDENLNVTPKSPLKEALWITAALLLVVIFFYSVSGFIVDLSVPYIPESVEISLAAIINSALQKCCKNHPDQGKLQDLLSGISGLIPGNTRSYSVLIHPDSKFNAFAAPGGTIMILQGLLDKVKSDQEIAFVMCHEIGHFSNRDHLRTLGRKLLGYITMTLLFGGKNPLNSTMETAFLSLDLKHSRTQELAADEFAADLLCRKYGSIDGAFQFFSTLKENEELPEILQFYSTHPKTDDRVAALKRIAEKKNYHYTKDKASRD